MELMFQMWNEWFFFWVINSMEIDENKMAVLNWRPKWPLANNTNDNRDQVSCYWINHLNNQEETTGSYLETLRNDLLTVCLKRKWRRHFHFPCFFNSIFDFNFRCRYPRTGWEVSYHVHFVSLRCVSRSTRHSSTLRSRKCNHQFKFHSLIW